MVQAGTRPVSPRSEQRELLTEKRGRHPGHQCGQRGLLHGLVKNGLPQSAAARSQWFYIQLREEGRAPPPGNPFLLLGDQVTPAALRASPRLASLSPNPSHTQRW